MQIDVWSDVMCPWCAVGRANLEAALAEPLGEPVEIRWRAFELDPSSPRRIEGDYVLGLARKYGRTREAAQQMIDQMTERGREVGVEFDFANIAPGNTFDAHRLLHLAYERGLQDALKDRLFRAYFAEGAAVGEPEVLRRLAVEVGLPEDEVRAVLESDRFADQVRGEEGLARQLGVTGVPFFVFDQRVAVGGAQPPEILRKALEHALETRESHAAAVQSPDAEVCGPDGCAV